MLIDYLHLSSVVPFADRYHNVEDMGGLGELHPDICAAQIFSQLGLVLLCFSCSGDFIGLDLGLV